MAVRTWRTMKDDRSDRRDIGADAGAEAGALTSAGRHDVLDHDASSARSLARRRWRPGLGTGAVVIAVLPIAVALARAWSRGWMAISDNGLLLLRSEDVFTSNHPLLGTWTSASLAAGRSLNNPGPLWFDLLGPFVRIGGPSVGLALGVAAANSACIALAAWAARRAGGDGALLVVTALSAGLAWSLGSELLFDPWQPHAMIFPFWSFLVVMWALGTGDPVMAPIALGLASLIIQTHLSFVYLLVVVGVTGAGLASWSARHAGSGRRWRKPLLAGGVVLLVAWIQPVIDQVAGEGNLFALAASLGNEEATFGLAFSIRFVASVVAFPPWWGRPGFSTTDVAADGITAGGLPYMSVLGLLAVVALLGLVVVAGRRRRSRPTVVIGALAAAAVTGSVASMTLSPIGVVGFSLHQLRWLWPISTFVLAALLFTLSKMSRVAHVARPVLAGAIAIFAVLALPMHVAPDGPARDAAYQPAVADLVGQIETYRPDGTVVFDTSTLRFAEPYSGPVIAALARAGVNVVATEEGMVRQLGSGRRADGSERRRVFLVEGSAARSTPDGSTRVAFVSGLDATEEIEWMMLSSMVTSVAAERGLRLNEAGVEAAAAGQTTMAEVVVQPGGDAAGLAAGGVLAILIANGWIDLPAESAEDWLRYAELDGRRQRFTVGLFEAPLPSP